MDQALCQAPRDTGIDSRNSSEYNSLLGTGDRQSNSYWTMC